MPAASAMRSIGIGATDCAISMSLGTRVWILVNLRAVAVMLFNEFQIRLRNGLSSHGRRDRLERRRRADGDQRLRITRPAVTIQEIVDIGTGALQGSLPRRDVYFQILRSLRGLSAIVYLHPDTSPVRQHLALAIERAPAGAIP